MDSWTASDLQRVEIKINHFSGMCHICTKCSLGRHLTGMRKACPEDFEFFPPTFVLPADRASLQRFLESGKLGSSSTSRDVVAPEQFNKERSYHHTKTSSNFGPEHDSQSGLSASKPGEVDNDCQLIPPPGDNNVHPSTNACIKEKTADSGIAFSQSNYDFLLTAEANRGVSNQQKVKKKRQRKQNVFISKPDSCSQGQGIQLVTNPRKLLSFGTTMDSQDKPSKVVQKYIDSPLLIGGHKFDLRLYACVTSVHPEPRVFLLVSDCGRRLILTKKSFLLCAHCLQNEGLARFATKPYKRPTTKNSKNKKMHLTNYAVNKGGKLQLQLDRLPRMEAENDSMSSVTESSASISGRDQSPCSCRTESNYISEQDPPMDKDEQPNQMDSDVEESLSKLYAEALENPLTDSNGVIVDPFVCFRQHEVLTATDECGSGGPKWSLSAVMSVLKEQHGIDVDRLWSETCDVVAKTVASIAPTLRHNYAASTIGTQSQRTAGTGTNSEKKSSKAKVETSKSQAKSFRSESEGFMCFEVLGFDIMFAYNDGSNEVKPQLIEVNQSPSFHSDSVLDAVVKLLAVGDGLRLGSVSESWLKRTFAPLVSSYGLSRSDLSDKPVKDIRTAYENVVCYGSLSEINRDDDRTQKYVPESRYIRLMPSSNPSKQIRYQHLMELACTASGSVLQGSSATLNRRREEALELRKQLEREQSLKTPKIGHRPRSNSYKPLRRSVSKGKEDSSNTQSNQTLNGRSRSYRSLSKGADNDILSSHSTLERKQGLRRTNTEKPLLHRFNSCPSVEDPACNSVSQSEHKIDDGTESNTKPTSVSTQASGTVLRRPNNRHPPFPSASSSNGKCENVFTYPRHRNSKSYSVVASAGSSTLFAPGEKLEDRGQTSHVHANELMGYLDSLKLGSYSNILKQSQRSSANSDSDHFEWNASRTGQKWNTVESAGLSVAGCSLDINKSNQKK